jgi:hypothetical protein
MGRPAERSGAGPKSSATGVAVAPGSSLALPVDTSAALLLSVLRGLIQDESFSR